MANELNIDLTPARTGYAMTVQLLLNGVLFGSPIAATEPSPGYYTATMSAPAGGYAVRFIVDGTTTIGIGFIAWDGTSEVNIANLPPLTTLQTTGAVNDALVAYAAAKALPAIR